MTNLDKSNLRLALIHIFIVCIETVGFAFILWHFGIRQGGGVVVLTIMASLGLAIWHLQNRRFLKEGQLPNPIGYYIGLAYFIIRIMLALTNTVYPEKEAVILEVIASALYLYAIYQQKQLG